MQLCRPLHGKNTETRNRRELPQPGKGPLRETSFLFNIVLRSLSRAIRQGKEIRAIHIANEAWNPSLIAEDSLSYVKMPRTINNKLLDLINECSKVSGYKINVQKSIGFFFTFYIYMNNPKMRLRKQTLFGIELVI